MRPLIQIVALQTLVPAVECGSRNTEHCQCLLGGKLRSLHQSDDLKLLGGRVSHSSSSPSPSMLFFGDYILGLTDKP